jgi:hypothetical protein
LADFALFNYCLVDFRFFDRNIQLFIFIVVINKLWYNYIKETGKNKDDNMLNKIKPLAERVVEYLGVELIPIEFDSTIQDDSRLVLKPVVEI